MSALFSIPAYPNATSYAVQYCDPVSGNPNRPNKLGPWNTLTGSPVTSPTNIYDSVGDPSLRVYRVAPTFTVPVVGSVTLPFYDAFSVRQLAPGVWTQNLYDAQITNLILPFRDFIGDYGNAGTASTDLNLDSGAGIGLLLPDGVTTQFTIADMPDSTPPIVLEYSVQIIKNGVDLIYNTDYTVDWEIAQVAFASAPLTSDVVTINYKEVRYSNRQLCSALQVAVDTLANFNINGYGIVDDNNVKTISGSLIPNGLRSLIFALSLKILNRALSRKKADEARAYKAQNFSIDTAPGRVLDGMSTQSNFDYIEIKAMANAYIRTATFPTVRDAYSSFFDTSGILPSMSFLVAGYYGAGWGYNAWI